MSFERNFEPRRSPRSSRSASTTAVDEARQNKRTSKETHLKSLSRLYPQKRAKLEPRRSTPRKGALGSKVMGYLEAPKIGQRILVLSQYSTQELPATVTKVAGAAVEVRCEVGGWQESIPHVQWFERTTPIEVVTDGSSANDDHLVEPATTKPRSRKGRTQLTVSVSTDAANAVVPDRLKNGAPDKKAVHQVVPIPTVPATPKWTSRPHLIVLLALTLSWCAYELLHASLGFENATLALVGTSAVLPTAALLAFRAAAALLVLSVLYSTLSDSTYLEVESQYMKGSALRSRLIRLRGMRRISTFTVWCWCLVGVYFTSATIATFAAYRLEHAANTLSMVEAGGAWRAWALKATWACFEVAFSTAVLVTVIVTFVLLPLALRGPPGKHDFMLNWRPVLMHNANVALMVADLLLGRLPVCASHLPLPLMWGAAYVLFAWGWHARTGVYYYPFLDHTLPWYKAVPMHVALLAALSAFHFLGAFVSNLAANGEDGIAAVSFEFRAASAAVLVAMITKVRR